MSGAKRLYRYVGPKNIAERTPPEPAGVAIHSPKDVTDWVKATAPGASTGYVIATFVLDATGVLLIADRHSEHVACAGGQPVLSAGEITFALGTRVEVEGISNQSTGYCPEPESWPSVAEALGTIGLSPPDGFTLQCAFRRCTKCRSLNLVKDDVYECGTCGAELPTEYNVQ